MTTPSQIPKMSEAIVAGISNTDCNIDMPIPQHHERQRVLAG
jgi:hypothetical protein